MKLWGIFRTLLSSHRLSPHARSVRINHSGAGRMATVCFNVLLITTLWHAIDLVWLVMFPVLYLA